MQEAFNGDHYLQDDCRRWVHEHGIKTIVETGTFYGQTTAFLASLPVQVVTIEVNPQWNRQAAHLAAYANVSCQFGESHKLLPAIIEAAEKPIFFFLDAHWQFPTPTPLELQAIAGARIAPYIWIHDCQVPGHPEFGFDRYADFAYDMAHIQPYLLQIYPDGYEASYNDKAAGAMRGCMKIKPAKKC